MSHEVELKLEIAPEEARRLRSQPWLTDAECGTEKQLSTYYDTSGHALRNEGYSLRVRLAGNRFIQTLKSMDSGAGLFARGEWEHDLDGPGPDPARLSHTPVADLDLRGLKSIVRSDISRTTCRLLNLGSEIEVDLDEGEIRAGKRQLPVSELELELVHGLPAAVFSLARKIAAETPVKLSVLSKAERGFALSDGKLSRPSKAETVPVQHGMTIAQGFATIVSACLRHFRLNEPLVIDTRAVEALHQVRVAMRRLRSSFSLFRPVIRDEESGQIREDLRWFTDELGHARNLDVYLEQELGPGQRIPLQREREAAYDSVIAAMDSNRFRSLMLDLAGWAALGNWREGPMAGQPVEPFVNHRIDRIWSKIAAAHRLRRMKDHERHRLRIRVKKLRYAVEFAAALHVHERDRQKQFGKALEDLQEELGFLNDMVVARKFVGSNEWLVDPHASDDDEREHVQAAAADLRRMRKIGPYWRT